MEGRREEREGGTKERRMKEKERYKKGGRDGEEKKNLQITLMTCSCLEINNTSQWAVKMLSSAH